MHTCYNHTEPGLSNGFKKNTKTFFQPKLSLSQPADAYEQEADAVADKVMRMPMPATNKQPFFAPDLNSLSFGVPIAIGRGEVLQRKCAHCEEEEKLQRKEKNNNNTEAGTTVENYIGGLSSPGNDLAGNTKTFFESRMGYDFSNVKIHTDAVAAKSAQSINALAYTSGNNIVFNQNQFSPETPDGKRLLAHELTHVVQQKNAPVIIQRQPKSSGSNIPTQTNMAANYYIAIILKGNFSIAADLFGITQQGLQKFNASDMVNDNDVCLKGSQFSLDINFCRGAPNTTPAPPITALAIEYREPGHFSSLKSVRRDESPIANSDQYRTCWQPNFPNSFKFDVYEKGTLTISAELFGTDNNELNIYSDTIEITKCPGQKKCYADAVATNRWVIIPDNGGPMHPRSGTEPEDGEPYEIYAETGTGKYFICKSEYSKEYVDRRGYAL